MNQPNHDYNARLKTFARAHRNGSTKAEVRLWCELFRKRQMLGFEFNRQRAIGHYIADFYCKELKLLIETDGATHFDPETQLLDQEKTAWLKTQGYTVLRFWDDEVMKNLDEVKKRIQDWILTHAKDRLPERLP